MCVCGSGDLMGFPAQQNAPARRLPTTTRLQTCSGACVHKHTLLPYRSGCQPQGHSSDGWTHPGVFYCWPVLNGAFEEQTAAIGGERQGKWRWKQVGKFYSNRIRLKNSPVKTAQTKQRNINKSSGTKSRLTTTEHGATREPTNRF